MPVQIHGRNTGPCAGGRCSGAAARLTHYFEGASGGSAGGIVFVTGGRD